MKNRNNSFIKNFFLLYLFYVIITFVLIFGFKQKNIVSEDFPSINNFISNTVSNDRIALIEERELSAKVKISLIDGAKESLKISYYKIQNDEAGDIFFSKIIEAANRGVKVELVIDGKLNKISKNFNGLNYLLTSNPNIEIRYYEPFLFFKPWTWNNILHDKYIIVDDKIVILGGRNIGNQYFAINGEAPIITKDREVLIINTDLSNYKDSALSQINNYFYEVWNSEYTKKVKSNLSKSNLNKASEKQLELDKSLIYVKDKHPELFNNSFDFSGMSYPANKITLINNPLTRYKKFPYIWGTITNLINTANSSVFIQSPYVIPTIEMQEFIDYEYLKNKKISILTNSEYASPNIFAFSGYLKHRKTLLKNNVDLYEYQGEGSIHAKSYIIDDRISLVGSFNMDGRSAYLSTETMFVIDSKDFAKALNDKVKILENDSILVNDKSNLDMVKRVPILKKVILRGTKVITYFFNYLL
jgi:putative cardiolipin synthase